VPDEGLSIFANIGHLTYALNDVVLGSFSELLRMLG